MSDRPPKYPYRSVDERAAPTSERRSSRVLGALSRLSKAHGAIEDSEVLGERARVARLEEQNVHSVKRCLHRHEALARGAYAEAESIYRAWLALAAASSHVVRDRVEVLSAHAAVAFASGNRARAEAALRDAVVLARTTEELSLHDDTPAAAVILLATTFRRLGEPAIAAALLAGTSGLDVRPLIVGAWEHAWAEVRLSLGELAAARAHARFAAATRYAAIGPRSTAHTATRALLGRILLATGELEEAEEVLYATLCELQSSGQHDKVIEVKVEAALGALYLLRGRTADGFAAARRALALIGRDDPYASTLPVRRTLEALFPHGPEAESIRRDIERIEAAYRS